MREEFDVPMLRAELVGLDASTWFRSVLIDRGRNHGVHSGMPLISDLGLVGLVTATSRNAAKGDAAARPPERGRARVVQRSRDRGVVRGTGDGLVFEFVGRDADVAPGDVLITSGLGGVFPKGLRIGVVASVEEASAQLQREASVDPVVDFGRLEQVFVMLRRSPTMDLLYATEGGDQSERRREEPGREARRSRSSRSCSAIPMLQGALAPFLPAGVPPRPRAARGVRALARRGATPRPASCSPRSCGFVVDLFSGALLGQHALLSRARVRGARARSRVHVSLIGALPQMTCAAALTVGARDRRGRADRVLHARRGVLAAAVLGRRCRASPSTRSSAPAVSWVVAGLVAWVAGEDVGPPPAADRHAEMGAVILGLDQRVGGGSETDIQQRVPWIAAFIVLVFAVFFARLFQLQVIQSDDLRLRSLHNSVRTLRVEAPRGDIVDRDGRILAATRPAFGVQLIPHDVRHPDVVIPALAQLIDREPGELRAQIGTPRGRAALPADPPRGRSLVRPARARRVAPLRAVRRGHATCGRAATTWAASSPRTCSATSARSRARSSRSARSPTTSRAR